MSIWPRNRHDFSHNRHDFSIVGKRCAVTNQIIAAQHAEIDELTALLAGRGFIHYTAS